MTTTNDNSVLKVLSDLVRRQVNARPNKTAFIFEDNSLTYAQLEQGSNRVANGLIGWGTSPNQRIGYLGKNSHHYYELLLGVSKSGGVLCPINWRLAEAEISYILNDFTPEILFIGPEFMDMAPSLKAQVSSLKHIVPMEVDKDGSQHYCIWRDSHGDNLPNIERHTTDDALQMYTSGTTGHPKGAILTNQSLLTAYERFRGHDMPNWNIWSDDDVSLIPMPCFHIGGTAWGLTTMAHGATGVIMRNFDPVEVLENIDKYRVSKLFLVPAAMKIVANLPRAKEVDFSQLKFMLYGASPMPLPLLKQAIDVFSCGFAQFYGMTETSGTISALPPEDHDLKGNDRMRSVGKALLGVEIVIMDDAGNRLPAGEIGEIVTRSSMNMKGYWNLAKATEETLTDEGWLRTGDVGYLDEDGYLFLKDRKKDMIISGGENVYPAEVENAIFDHPKVADVAVIGVPDEKWGETVKAYVVIKSGESLTDEEVIAWTRDKIAKYKCPKSVDFLETLPRNPSGKVLRRLLRAPSH
ncbi:MAG: fatty acid--CoA ligase [Maricaulaceae bacterium]